MDDLIGNVTDTTIEEYISSPAAVVVFGIANCDGCTFMDGVLAELAPRLQVQERLTVQIAETLQEKLSPQGVAVVIEARHLCMMMRGVETPNAVAVTSSMHGVFLNQQKTREELLELIRRGGSGSGV